MTKGSILGNDDLYCKCKVTTMFEALLTRGKPFIEFTTGIAASAKIVMNPDSYLVRNGVVVYDHGGAARSEVTLSLLASSTYRLMNPPSAVTILSKALTAIVSWGARDHKWFVSFRFGIHNDTEYSSSNLVSVPNYLPRSVTSLLSMFARCTNFNSPNVSAWDISNVSTLWDAFYQCPNFNQNLNSWNTANVDTVHGTFHGCSKYNQPMNNWNMRKVFHRQDGANGGMTTMFNDCVVFNQDLSSWKVPLIPSKPGNFDVNTPAWNKTNRQPQWGVS